jgi:hypothetical protein
MEERRSSRSRIVGHFSIVDGDGRCSHNLHNAPLVKAASCNQWYKEGITTGLMTWLASTTGLMT